MEILRVEDLSFTYPGSPSKALDRISFSIDSGDFLAVIGATGSGKTTLISLIKRELAPLGEMSGCIYIDGRRQELLDERESARLVGCVVQDPEHQIVTDKVWHELAFGLENLGVHDDTMKHRVAEIASFFGIENWFDRSVHELSGGQKQLLALASVTVMQPKILILDEPTAQLDPIAAAEFINAVKRLCVEFSMTVIMIEHRIEEVIPISDKLLALRDGRVAAFGETGQAVSALKNDPILIDSLPSATRLYLRLENAGTPPLTSAQGKRYIESSFTNAVRKLPERARIQQAEPALELKELYFRYERRQSDVLRSLSLTVNKGEIFCVLGGNGSGKSTMLGTAAGILKPYSGSIRIFGKKIKEYGGSLYRNNVALLTQDVKTLFLKNTVGEELAEMNGDASSLPFDVSAFADRHPYDLSGGEQQLAALAKVLMTEPKLLLLDEPTKGLDVHTRRAISEILGRLKDRGVTVVIVTHDIEFAASVSDRCAMLFRGEITSCGEPREFFSENSFYTTAISRMTRGFFENATTVDEAEELCLMNERRHICS